MADPYHRIQEHLGQALRKLSLLQDRAAARQDIPRDVARCLTDLRQVAQELDHAFDAIKGERQRIAIVAQDADAAMRRARNLFGQSPSACLVLHRDHAAIADANEAASRLLNVSHRHLIGKTFTNFLQQDRELFLQQLQRGADGVADQWHVTLRPRERALVRVLVNAIADNQDTAAIILLPAVTGALMDGGAAGYAEV
jgi:PAS domain-containing protein